jgi:hypothetical protein
MGLGMLEGGWANSIYSGYGVPVLWMDGWMDGLFWFWMDSGQSFDLSSHRVVSLCETPHLNAQPFASLRASPSFFSRLSHLRAFLLDKFTMLMLGRLFFFFFLSIL